MGYITTTMKTKTALLGSLLTTTWTVAAFAAATFTVVRLTDSAGCSRQPASDGSGKHVAFVSEADLVPPGNADGNFEVFLRDAKTGFQQITNTTSGFSDKPSINKAGSRIAFMSDRDLVTGENADGNVELFVFDKKKGFIQITDTTDGNGADDPSFGNAGVHIAFTSDRDLVADGNTDENREVFLWDKKKGFIQITTTSGSVINTATAGNANGSRIAFVSTGDLVSGENADASQEIFLFDKKKGFRQITSGAATCSSRTPAITPSGTRIAFSSNCDLVTGSNSDGNSEIFFFDAKKGLSQITQTTSAVSMLPALDNRGNRIAFMSDADLVPGGNADLNLEAFLYDPKKGFSQLSDSTGGSGEVAGAPALSNNGKRIAFELNGVPEGGGTNTDGDGEIYLAEED